MPKQKEHSATQTLRDNSKKFRRLSVSTRSSDCQSRLWSGRWWHLLVQVVGEDEQHFCEANALLPSRGGSPPTLSLQWRGHIPPSDSYALAGRLVVWHHWCFKVVVTVKQLTTLRATALVRTCQIFLEEKEIRDEVVDNVALFLLAGRSWQCVE